MLNLAFILLIGSVISVSFSEESSGEIEKPSVSDAVFMRLNVHPDPVEGAAEQHYKGSRDLEDYTVIPLVKISGGGEANETVSLESSLVSPNDGSTIQPANRDYGWPYGRNVADNYHQYPMGNGITLGSGSNTFQSYPGYSGLFQSLYPRQVTVNAPSNPSYDPSVIQRHHRNAQNPDRFSLDGMKVPQNPASVQYQTKPVRIFDLSNQNQGTAGMMKHPDLMDRPRSYHLFNPKHSHFLEDPGKEKAGEVASSDSSKSENDHFQRNKNNAQHHLSRKDINVLQSLHNYYKQPTGGVHGIQSFPYDPLAKAQNPQDFKLLDRSFVNDIRYPLATLPVNVEYPVAIRRYADLLSKNTKIAVIGVILAGLYYVVDNLGDDLTNMFPYYHLYHAIELILGRAVELTFKFIAKTANLPETLIQGISKYFHNIMKVFKR